MKIEMQQLKKSLEVAKATLTNSIEKPKTNETKPNNVVHK